MKNFKKVILKSLGTIFVHEKKCCYNSDNVSYLYLFLSIGAGNARNEDAGEKEGDNTTNTKGHLYMSNAS
jgi:hypothetical protein